MRIRTGLVLSLAPLLASASAYAGLNVGDQAPPLKIKKWVKGDPVKLSDGKGKNVYVLEFWATWCRPCHEISPYMNQLQTLYKDKGVVFVGVTDDQIDRVEQYVKQNGDRLTYAIACDDNHATTMAYMAAARVPGIPWVFVIDKRGKLAWLGHPMDGLRQVLEQIVAGKFDPIAFQKQREKARDLARRLDEAAAAQKWDEALSLLEELRQVSLEPDVYHLTKFQLCVRKGDREAAEAAGREVLESVDRPDMLNGLAWALLTEEPFAGDYNKTALAFAKKACESSDKQNWTFLNTYARAKFETGDAAGAAELQQQVVALAEKDKGAPIEELRKSLQRYLDGQQAKP